MSQAYLNYYSKAQGMFGDFYQTYFSTSVFLEMFRIVLRRTHWPKKKFGIANIAGSSAAVHCHCITRTAKYLTVYFKTFTEMVVYGTKWRQTNSAFLTTDNERVFLQLVYHEIEN
jgi:hypothetical protein